MVYQIQLTLNSSTKDLKKYPGYDELTLLLKSIKETETKDKILRNLKNTLVKT